MYKEVVFTITYNNDGICRIATKHSKMKYLNSDHVPAEYLCLVMHTITSRGNMDGYAVLFDVE